MQTYKITFKYSKDGRFWTSTTKHVKAMSDMAAIAQISSMYPYVKEIRVLSIR